MVLLKQFFEKFEDEYIQFERIQAPPTLRPDLCAFLLLDRLVPASRAGRDMITGAGHEVIYLDVDMQALAEAASEEDVCTLVRCGVRYDAEYDCLALFV
jgi:hypothetical protein